MPTFTASELAQQLGGEVIGDSSLPLSGFAPAEGARAGHLTFAENEKYLSKAEQGGASAVLVGGSVQSSSKTLIRVADARVAFAKVLPLFFPEKQMPAGIHPTAVIAASAVVHPTAHVGPHCVVSERAQIGAGSVLLGNDHVGEDVRLGEKVCLFPNVTIYAECQLGDRVRVHSGTVIGADGFGYVFDQGQHRKVLQIGNVIIHDDVELGANVCVDRAALGSTVIGRGTKVDNLAQIAHNVVIGQGCLIVGQAGIGGSSTLGDFVVLAGQAGVIGHIHIGNRAIIAAKSGVMEDIPEGQKWAGTPAGPDLEVKRQWVATRRLREFLQRLVKIEKQVADLTRDSKG